MHELSIALSIIEGVEDELTRRGVQPITAVHLKLGPLSGVVKEALLFSYQLACEDTLLAGSRLEIEEVPTVIYCPSCEREQPVVSIQCMCCITCGTPSADIRKGSELHVFALEFSHDYAAAPG